MIILRQKTYATSASFKPKFRKRFRSGDFSYIPAKNPRDEMMNHQAYKEVACEDEFKNNPETYKIRQGLFSSINPSPKYLKKEKELEKKGYAVLPKVKGRKKDFVYFSNGKETVGYNLWTAEEHKL